jgi:hypothetical protein
MVNRTAGAALTAFVVMGAAAGTGAQSSHQSYPGPAERMARPAAAAARRPSGEDISP